MKLFVDAVRISPYSYSVLCALRAKGVPCSIEDVSFDESGTPASFAGRTFTDLIPALEDDGWMLSESLAILEYLEEKFTSPQFPSIYPDDPRERAQARMLLSWYRCGMQALRRERSTLTLFVPAMRATEPLSKEASEEVSDWLRFLSAVRKPGSQTLFGRWSIADSETALMLHRLILNGYPLGPDLENYAHKIWERPAEREFVCHPRASLLKQI